MLDDHLDMASDAANRPCASVTRYTISACLRTKLGEALRKRNVAPHIFESADEARGEPERMNEPLE